MIGVTVRDHGAIHRPQRIDKKAARFAKQAAWQNLQPCRGMQHGCHVGSG
jgi:hypothetical protein